MVIIVLLLVIGYLLIVSGHIPVFGSEAATSTPHAPSSKKIDTVNAVSVLSKKISVLTPLPDASVSNSFIIEGKAPGSWFFEAVFPIQIRNSSNEVIGHATARAQSDWMTDKLVYFTAPVQIDGYHGKATLILLRDNPSGLPENDDSMTIPVIIK